MTMLLLVTWIWSATAIVWLSTKQACPRMRSASGMSCTSRSAKPTKRSRSRLTRSMTLRPSMRIPPSTWMPKPGALATAWAASAAAMRSLLGMQPTRAQVVPYSPPSIITALTPAALAARYAVMPAVPAPITATSTCMLFMSYPRFTDRRRRDDVRLRMCQGTASGRFARAEIRFQVVCVADELAADEHLRPGAAAGNRPQRARGDVLAEADFGVTIALGFEQRLGARAIRAAGLGENHHRLGHNRFRVDAVSYTH